MRTVVGRMWTLALIVSLSFFGLIEAVPAPGRGALKGYCNTNADCGKRKCCVSFETPRGNRAAETNLSDDLRKFVKGKCKKRGKSNSGSCVKQCSSNADCGRFECCVSNTSPRGKRSAAQAQGQCKPMGKRDSACLVSNNPGRQQDIYFHSCPCVKRKSCVGTGFFEIPLGEIGRCKNNKRMEEKKTSR